VTEQNRIMIGGKESIVVSQSDCVVYRRVSFYDSGQKLQEQKADYEDNFLFSLALNTGFNAYAISNRMRCRL
jgi:hypothetical protein